MRTTILLASFSGVLGLQANPLRVDYSTAVASYVITEACECESAEGYLVARQPSAEGEPGTISLAISGGTPPYSVNWHTAVSASGVRINAWPGMHRVTVIDAVGERVTRSIHVGQTSRTVHPDCPPCPETEPNIIAVAKPIVGTTAKASMPQLERRILAEQKEVERSSPGNGDAGRRTVRTTERTGGQGGRERRPFRTAQQRR
jgi:hypothetical protein